MNMKDLIVKMYNFLQFKILRKSKFTTDNLKMKNVYIGKFTYGNPIIMFWNDSYAYKVIIGKFCSISSNVKIIVDGNHRLDWVTTYPFGELFKNIPKNSNEAIGKGDIIIGNDVWIGRDATILPGVRVGDGAVISAAAVVTKNVSDYEVVGGNPARHIKYRFEQNQIEALKTIKWWDWPIEKIKKNYQLLQSSEINEFIKENLEVNKFK